MSPVGDHIAFTHWNNTVKGCIEKADRPALLQQAADNDWTPKQVTDECNRLGSAMEKPTITLNG